MIDELNEAFETFQTKWDALVAGRSNRAFFEGLKPTSIAWKTTDLEDFDRRFAELREKCDQIHLGWINERWLATMHLREGEVKGGIKLIKLMQRRPGSTDAVGLDHLDFYSPDDEKTKQVLSQEPDLKWTKEDNGHCRWISLWFANTEAKIREQSVLDVCIQELENIKNLSN